MTALPACRRQLRERLKKNGNHDSPRGGAGLSFALPAQHRRLLHRRSGFVRLRAGTVRCSPPSAPSAERTDSLSQYRRQASPERSGLDQPPTATAETGTTGFSLFVQGNAAVVSPKGLSRCKTARRRRADICKPPSRITAIFIGQRKTVKLSAPRAAAMGDCHITETLCYTARTVSRQADPVVIKPASDLNTKLYLQFFLVILTLCPSLSVFYGSNTVVRENIFPIETFVSPV